MGATRKIVAVSLLFLAAALLAGVVIAAESAPAPDQEKPAEQPAAKTDEAKPAEKPPEQAPTLPAPKVALKSTSLGKPDRISEEDLSYAGVISRRTNILVSPDGKRFAATDGENLMIDGEVKKLKSVQTDSMAFSADSKHFLYAGTSVQSSAVVMLDGAETVAKGPIVTASLSQDGKHVAYVYEENGKQIAVVDGVTGKPYDQIFFKGHREQCWSSFSPDGKRFAYVALAADKWVMVLDGKESPPYDRIAIVAELGRWGPFFSPDSKHFVYMAQEGLKFSFVFDGAKREDMLEMPVFSPDGAHMAFRAQEGDKNIFYYKKDDKPRPENQEYSDVRSPVFSPDSQHFAHAARSNTGDALIVLDGAETKVEGNIKRIVFSPDSKHVACVTSAKIYVDGAEKWKGDMRDDTLVFSPDSKRFAFIASGGAGFAESWLVIDGSNGQGFADLGFKKRFMNQFKNIPVFSPDSRHAACYRMTLEGSSVVVDGTESKTDLVPLCPPVFDSPTKFHFIGLKGDKEVVLVEAEISEPEKQK